MKINETTGTTGSPGTKGYTGFMPSEKYARYKTELARIIKKTTGYEMVDLEPVVMDTIDVKDNEINQDDVEKVNSFLRSQGTPNYIHEITIVKDNEINTDDIDDKNIASPKRHKELEKDFQKQMNESMPTLKELLFGE